VRPGRGPGREPGAARGAGEVAGVHHIVAQVLAFPASSLLTFALSRRWAFAAP
jgi:hypothetical protein